MSQNACFSFPNSETAHHFQRINYHFGPNLIKWRFALHGIIIKMMKQITHWNFGRVEIANFCSVLQEGFVAHQRLHC